MTQLQEIKNTRTRQEWAEIINADWRKSIESIFKVADDLVAAREDLGKKEFYSMVRADLEISPSVAWNLLKIGGDEKLKSIGRTSLPSSWKALVELTTLKKEDFDWAASRGLISEDTTIGGARVLKKISTNDDGPIQVGTRQRDLPSPKEARAIARETGKPVAASDGNIHFGHSDERVEEIQQQRAEDYGVIRSVEKLAEVTKAKSAEDWWKDMPDWRRGQISHNDVDAAINWLSGLYEAMTNAH